MDKLYTVYFVDDSGAELGKVFAAESDVEALHKFQKFMMEFRKNYKFVSKMTCIKMKNEGF